MESIIVGLKREHEGIKDILDEIERFINKAEEISPSKVEKTFEGLNSLWSKHEFKENRLFERFILRNNPVDGGEMFIDQHKELRDHWKIIREAIYSEDKGKIREALNKDGKILIDKFRKHIEEEEKFFRHLEKEGIKID